MELILIFVFMFMLAPAVAQDNNVVLLNGYVRDITDGKPVTTKVKFINSSGSILEARTNSEDGSFQLVLPNGHNYNIVIEGYLQTDHDVMFDLSKINKYSEMARTLNVMKLEQGLELLAIDAFVDNDSKPHDTLSKYLDFIKHLLVQQKGLHLELIINSVDSYFKDKTVKKTITEKGKKKTVNVNISAQEQLKELLEKRSNTLRELIKPLKIQERNAIITTDLIVAPPPKPVKKTKSKTPEQPKEPVFDLTVKIARVMKM